MRHLICVDQQHGSLHDTDRAFLGERLFHPSCPIPPRSGIFLLNMYRTSFLDRSGQDYSEKHLTLFEQVDRDKKIALHTFGFGRLLGRSDEVNHRYFDIVRKIPGSVVIVDVSFI